MDMRTQFLKNCKKYHNWLPETRVLLAVSGGVDSMVLLDLVEHLPEDIKPQFAVAHVNHQLRTIADEEEQFIQSYCEERQIPFYSKKWNAKTHPTSGIESAARQLRYDFFQKVMEQENFTQLLTAHHGDDQVETILMRLVRGSHLSGLTGIKAQRFLGKEKRNVIRPLLDFSKKELLDYSILYKVPYYEDETNKSLAYTRNRYRNQIIPLLKKENEHLLEHVKNVASDIDDLLILVEPVIQKALNQSTLKKNDSEIQLDIRQILDYEEVLCYQLFNQLFIQLQETKGFVFQRIHIQKVLDLIKSTRPNGQIQLSKEWQAIRSYDILTITNQSQNKKKEIVPFEQKVNLNEQLNLPNGDQISLFTTETIPKELLKTTNLVIRLAPERITLPLIVRHRKNGDRMTLKGKITATRKIKDILIDQKVPLEDRDKAYLVQDFTGEILWLIKYKESQLSIDEETDKIQYILVYQKNELY